MIGVAPSIFASSVHLLHTTMRSLSSQLESYGGLLYVSENQAHIDLSIALEKAAYRRFPNYRRKLFERRPKRLPKLTVQR